MRRYPAGLLFKYEQLAGFQLKENREDNDDLKPPNQEIGEEVPLGI